MRLAVMMGVASLAAMLGSAWAEAAPAALPRSDVAVGPAPQIELVRGGCGWGAHRGWYGHCRYNRGWRGRVRWHRSHWY